MEREDDFGMKAPKTLEEMGVELSVVRAELKVLYAKLDKHKSGEELLSDEEHRELESKIDNTCVYVDILSDQIESRK